MITKNNDNNNNDNNKSNSKNNNNKKKVIHKGLMGTTNKISDNKYVLYVDIDNNYNKDKLLSIMKKYELTGIIYQSNSIKFEHDDSYVFANNSKKYHVVCFNIMTYKQVKNILSDLYIINLCDKYFYEAFAQLKKNTLRIMPKHDYLSFKLIDTFDFTHLGTFTYIHTNLIHLYECLLNKLIWSSLLRHEFKQYEYHEIEFSMYDYELLD